MFPTDATIFANRSLCWLHMAEGDLALEDAQRAKSLGRNWPKAYYRVGAAFMSLKVTRFNIKNYDCTLMYSTWSYSFKQMWYCLITRYRFNSMI